MLPVTFDFEVKFFESTNPAVTGPPEPTIEGVLCLIRILALSETATYFLPLLSTVQTVIVFGNHGHSVLLILSQVLRSLAECIS